MHIQLILSFQSTFTGSGPIFHYPSRSSSTEMFFLRTSSTKANSDKCGPGCSSCMARNAHSASDRSPTISNGQATMATNASTDADRRQHSYAHNLIDLIITTAMTLLGLCAWCISILWETKGQECFEEGKERCTEGEKGKDASHEVDHGESGSNPTRGGTEDRIQ